MNVTVHRFYQQKSGNGSDEYEDAWGFGPETLFIKHDENPTKISNWENECLWFAVADGATETSFSNLWAQLLVDSYGRGLFQTKKHPIDSLSEIQAEWLRNTDVRLEGKSWSVREKAQKGAFAAIAGITLARLPARKPCGCWKALTVGDCCVFYIKENQISHDSSGIVEYEIAKSIPYSRTEEFDKRPTLLSSNPLLNDVLRGNITIYEHGEKWEAPCYFILATDALACCLLRLNEEMLLQPIPGEIPQTDAEFETFVNKWRHKMDPTGQPYLKNDDVTLITVFVSD